MREQRARGEERGEVEGKRRKRREQSRLRKEHGLLRQEPHVGEEKQGGEGISQESWGTEVGMVCCGGAGGIEKGRRKAHRETPSWGNTGELRLQMIGLKL